MTEYIVVGLMLVAVACDAWRDKRASHTGYRDWHREYPIFKPQFIWRKVQNRWHIVKQISFLLPHIVILYWVAQQAWWLGTAYIVGGAIAWALPKAPEHWRK